MEDMIRNAYDALGDDYYKNRKNATGVSHFYNENLEMPATLKMLGIVRGKKILDLGCGPGLYASELIKRGAKVKGIDISKKLISIARKEASEGEFRVGDAESLPYKNGEFDIVVSSLVLGHFDSWKKILSEVKRVLKKKGFFVFSGYNPVADVFVKEKWFFKKFRTIKGYFKEEWKKGLWIGDGRGAKIVHHHKTYGTIVRYLVSGGFEIIDYEDCRPSKESEELYPELYKRFNEMPYFCTWKVRKK